MKNIHFVAEIIQTQGILLRTGLILERRGFILEALETFETKGRTFLNIRVKGEEVKKEQAIKQLAKLIDVISIQEATGLELENFEKEFQPVAMLA
ncbi:MAG TPA: ACT domain-containing protein [Cytophagaceae bacterium]|jgi:acetolactate synthase small subunit|nr:ACT domain-containing protein [Cytophagaceae bacterium]